MKLTLASAVPAGLRHGLSRQPWTTARLYSIDSAANRASVSINGGPPVSLPYITNVYTGITTVFVLLDPNGSGAGQLVLGPCGTASTGTPAPVTPSAPTTKTYHTTIRPTWSGTWSTKWGRYYAWNVGRYGGSSTLYQSQAFSSQQLYGIAVYGNQIKALGADAITAATLYVPAATGSGNVQVQGTPQGTSSPGLPTPTGATATGALGGTISLGSTMRDNLRTGTSKGIVLVGTDYLAVYGTSSGKGMALSLTYTRTS